MRSIVVGLGNSLLQDDHIGPYLVECLENEQALSGVEYYRTDESGMYLVEKLVGYDQALLIDSVKTDAANWGKVWLYTTADFEAIEPSSAHGIDFFAGIRLLQNLGVKIPTKIGIIAVGVKSNTIFNEHFSSVIEQRKAEIYQKVKNIAIDFFA